MEQITKHEYLDVYRIADGVLLKVKKYKDSETCHIGWHTIEKYKSSLTKLKGLKNLFVVNSDIKCEYGWFELNVGDVIFESEHIIPITNPSEYRYEIKTTGEMFSGNYKEVSNYLYIIIEIMDKYLNE